MNLNNNRKNKKTQKVKRGRNTKYCVYDLKKRKPTEKLKRQKKPQKVCVNKKYLNKNKMKSEVKNNEKEI